MKKTLAFNRNGNRIGENHPLAKLLDREIDQVLELLDEPDITLQEVADKFGVSKACIWKIKTGRRRCQTPERLVEVSVPDFY